MHRVMRHIDSNLASPLELVELATVANFSAFDFHRLFAAWTGERVGDYVRRRRLEVAAVRLVTQPSATVLEVALSVGFASSEAFSRSFKLHFAQSPSVWRSQQMGRKLQSSKHSQHDSKLDQASLGQVHQHGNHHNPLMEHEMKVELKSLERVEVAYLRHVGP
jgi:AraC family transcriptional regulator